MEPERTFSPRLQERLGERFLDLWDDQADYNTRVKEADNAHLTPEEWSTTYLLGMVSEIDEVLREINWKRHRKDLLGSDEPDRDRLAMELADLTKYLLSLWQVWGFDAEEMLGYTRRKSNIVDIRFFYEFKKPSEGQPVLIFDLDETIADYRGAFLRWCQGQGEREATAIFREKWGTSARDMTVVDEYEKYRELKDKFDEVGEYINVDMYDGALEYLGKARKLGWYLVCCTARPTQRYPMVASNTHKWMEDFCVPHDVLYFMGEDRVKLAQAYRDMGHRVMALEDNPEHALRISSMGITVLLKQQKYNEYLLKRSHPYMIIFEEYGKYSKRSMEALLT